MASSATSPPEAGLVDRAQSSAMLAEVFAADPILRRLIPSQRETDRRLRRLFTLAVAH